MTAAACADDDGTGTAALDDTSRHDGSGPDDGDTSHHHGGGLAPRIQDIEEAGALDIDTSGNADWVTVAGDSAWLANVGTGSPATT